MNNLKIGKTISYALRHNPGKYSLTPDKEGYVKVSDLIDGLYSVDNIKIDLSDIERIIKNSDKKRYEINDGKIRATYGHSTVSIEKEKVKPPEVLYHGTTHKAYKSIQAVGLRSMERQFVHLSEDIKTAEIVGKRRESNPVILKIDSRRAHENGVGFYRGNDTTWLSDEIPAEYINLL